MVVDQMLHEMIWYGLCNMLCYMHAFNGLNTLHGGSYLVV